jgi:hypothetical protein
MSKAAAASAAIRTGLRSLLKLELSSEDVRAIDEETAVAAEVLERRPAFDGAEVP